MKDDVVVLEIDQLAAGGYGLARTQDGVVFVRGALPGERVTGRPRLRDGVLKAHAIEIVEAHPARVDMPLPPGADLPLRYEAQLPLKEGLVREALARIGKVELDLQPIAPSPRELGYRTAAQYAVAPVGVGARESGSNKIAVLEDDVLVCEPIRIALQELRPRSLHGVSEVAFRASLHEGRVVAGLLGDNPKAAAHHARSLQSPAGVVWSELDDRGRFRGRTTLLAGTDRLVEDFGGIHSTVTVQSFAQVNPAAAGLLYEEAAAIAGGGERLVDLYAGAGVLAMHLVAEFTEAIAIEISADAVGRGRADARRQGRRNLEFHRGDARTAKKFLPADLVAVDPPRAGLGEDVVDLLGESGPQKLLYVSCDPATWARDVARLASRGYRLTFARPYDFYPFTHHVEVLSLLER